MEFVRHLSGKSELAKGEWLSSTEGSQIDFAVVLLESSSTDWGHSLLEHLVFDAAIAHLASSPKFLECCQSLLSSGNKKGILVRHGMADILRKGVESNILSSSQVISLTRMLFPMVADSDLTSSEIACELLFAFAKSSPSSVIPLIVPDGSDILDSVISSRYSALHSRIAGISGECFNVCRDCGLVDQIVTKCKSGDVLLVLVILELIPDLAQSQEGLQYLYDCGMFDFLVLLSCGSPDEQVPDPFLGEQALRELSKILVLSYKISGNRITTLLGADFMHKVMTAISNILGSTTQTERLTGLFAASEIACASVNGLESVVSNVEVLDGIMTLLRSTPEVQAACLHAIGRMIEENSDHSGDLAAFARSSTIKKTLFEGIGIARSAPSTASYLLQTLRKPVSETRHGAYHILIAIIKCDPQYGLITIFQIPEFMPYLEQRATEFNKEGKEWRFSLMSAIHESPNKTILGDEVVAEIKKYVDQGPFHVEVEQSEMLTI